MKLENLIPGEDAVTAGRPSFGAIWRLSHVYNTPGAAMTMTAAAVGLAWPKERWGKPGLDMTEYGDRVLQDLVERGAAVPRIRELGEQAAVYLFDLLPRAAAVEEVAGNSSGTTAA